MEWECLPWHDGHKFGKGFDYATLVDNSFVFVGTPDNLNVDFIGFGIRENNPPCPMNMYYFKDDTPHFFRRSPLPLFNNPFWPENRPRLNDRYKPLFIELGNQIPSLRKSLEICVEHLSRPPGSYTDIARDIAEEMSVMQFSVRDL